MNIITIIRKILNLNWKEVMIFDFHYELNKTIYSIRWKYSTTCCTKCGLKTSKRKWRQLHKQKQTIKHMSYGWNKIIELKLYKRYFKCINCNINFYEKFNFESEYWNYTKDFEKYVVWSFGFLSGNKKKLIISQPRPKGSGLLVYTEI